LLVEFICFDNELFFIVLLELLIFFEVVFMSYFPVIIFALTCGSLVQASSFDPSEFGYSENVLLNVMMERGATTYKEAAFMLDREALKVSQSFEYVEEKKSDSVSDRDEEASLALIRRLEKEDKLLFSPTVDIDEALSLAFIRKLQEQEGGSAPSFSYASVLPMENVIDPRKVLLTHKEALKGLFLSAQKFDGGDVHAFNKGWSKTNIGKIQPIFTEAFGNPSSLSMSALKAEILKYEDTLSVRNALAQLEAYGDSGFSDAESGVANTLQILSQNWHIASTATGLNRKFVFNESGIAKNSRDFIIYTPYQ
jgi:hypothetical protein